MSLYPERYHSDRNIPAGGLAALPDRLLYLFQMNGLGIRTAHTFTRTYPQPASSRI